MSNCETESDHHEVIRKPPQTPAESNLSKRKAHDSISNDNSPKNHNKSVPLKKRNVLGRKEELNFLNLISNENSNDANMESLSSNSRSSTLRGVDAPLNVVNNSNSSKQENNNNVCDCLNCFPALGSAGSSKCLKKTDSNENIDSSMVAGPSGLQSSAASFIASSRKLNIYDSDSDDSDIGAIPPPLTPASRKIIKAAPDLQLDWLSDSSHDDDVIFVSDRSDPIDLTADSDNDEHQNSSNNNETNESSSAPNNEGVSTIREPVITSNPIHLYRPDVHCIQRFHPTTVNTQRTPIMSSCASVNVHSIPSPPQIVIRPRSPYQPVRRSHDIRNVITGNDVMLDSPYTNPFLANPSNTPHPRDPRLTSNTETYNPPQQRESLIRPGFNLIGIHPVSVVSQVQNDHQVILPNHETPTNYSTNSSNASESSIPTSNSNSQQQSYRTRCPFVQMSENHHHNRPRRYPREYFATGRPYAIHEDLYRRQYQEQEIRRHFWAPPEYSLSEDLRPPPTNHSFMDRRTSQRNLSQNAPIAHSVYRRGGFSSDFRVDNAQDLSGAPHIYHHMHYIPQNAPQHVHLSIGVSYTHQVELILKLNFCVFHIVTTGSCQSAIELAH